MLSMYILNINDLRDYVREAAYIIIKDIIIYNEYFASKNVYYKVKNLGSILSNHTRTNIWLN